MPTSITGNWSNPALHCTAMRDDLRSGCTDAGGFTLIELMVVMVLITVITAFTLPTLRSSLFSDQLRATTRRIVGLVSEASQQAAGSQSPSQLNFDLEENRVWLSSSGGKLADGAPEMRQQVILPETVRVVDVASVHGGKVAQGTATIRFSNKGYVDRTFIHLRSDDGRDMTLMLSPFIAVTKIVDSYVELDDEAVRY